MNDQTRYRLDPVTPSPLAALLSAGGLGPAAFARRCGYPNEAMANCPEAVPCYGRVTGFFINYTPHVVASVAVCWRVLRVLPTDKNLCGHTKRTRVYLQTPDHR